MIWRWTPPPSYSAFSEKERVSVCVSGLGFFFFWGGGVESPPFLSLSLCVRALCGHVKRKRSPWHGLTPRGSGG